MSTKQPPLSCCFEKDINDRCVARKPTLTAYIDNDFSAEQSLLLRYYGLLSEQRPEIMASKENLAASSIAEGARIFRLVRYRGVNIWVCDESSLMVTGTYKDLDACLMAAIAKRTGLRSIVLSSGGNLGYAMARYARQAGIQVYFFHPKSTLYKLDAANFAWDGVKVITVDRSEREVKMLARTFADTYGITLVPDLEWRFAASAVRAMHIAEKFFGRHRRLHWLTQAICAGFGPVGVYDSWSWLIRKGSLEPNDVPRFLGIQQAANAPIVRAWQAGERAITQQHSNKSNSDAYIEPGLYNTNPNINYGNLLNLTERFGGTFLGVEKEAYYRHEETVLGWFREAGLEFTRKPQTGEILERAGLLTGVGLINAIEQNVVKPGSRVLYLLTGGFRKLSSFEPLQPDLVVDATGSIADCVRHVGQTVGL